MERLAEKREQFRVDIRKKHHENMLTERRIRLIEEHNSRMGEGSEGNEQL